MAFVAKITGWDGAAGYGYREVRLCGPARPPALPTGQGGTGLAELNGCEDVPAGTLVIVHCLPDGTLVFQAPRVFQAP